MKYNTQQTKAIELARAGRNLFISGSGGTGKSAVIHEIRNQLKVVGKKVLLCAPSGTAAQLIGGTTCHRAFGFKESVLLSKTGAKSIRRTNGPVREADVIIIDEISLCRVDMFDAIINSIQKVEKDQGKKIQLILVGDFYQLPPVIRDKGAVKGESSEKEVLELAYGDKLRHGYAFQSALWRMMNFEFVELSEVMRTDDPAYIRNMELARIGDIRSLEWFQKNSSISEVEGGIYILPTAVQADLKNISELRKLHRPIVEYRRTTEGDVQPDEMSRVPEILELSVGARVFCVINDVERRLHNGLQGNVIELEENSVKVQFDNGITETIEPYTFKVLSYQINGANEFETVEVGSYTQIPLRLAYAITVHRAQGATFDKVNLETKAWDPGQLYVGLSRCRNIYNLHTGIYIDHHYLITDDLVKQFYDCLRNDTEFQDILRPAGKDTDSSTIRVPRYLSPKITRICKEWNRLKPQDRYEQEVLLCPANLLDKVMNYISGLQLDQIE